MECNNNFYLIVFMHWWPIFTLPEIWLCKKIYLPHIWWLIVQTLGMITFSCSCINIWYQYFNISINLFPYTKQLIFLSGFHCSGFLIWSFSFAGYATGKSCLCIHQKLILHINALMDIEDSREFDLITFLFT